MTLANSVTICKSFKSGKKKVAPKERNTKIFDIANKEVCFLSFTLNRLYNISKLLYYDDNCSSKLK